MFVPPSFINIFTTENRLRFICAFTALHSNTSFVINPTQFRLVLLQLLYNLYALSVLFLAHTHTHTIPCLPSLLNQLVLVIFLASLRCIILFQGLSSFVYRNIARILLNLERLLQHQFILTPSLLFTTMMELYGGL